MAGARTLQSVLPQDTIPTWYQTPALSHTRGPPESPCSWQMNPYRHIRTIALYICIKILRHLSSYTWQEETPEAPAQIMASVILLWPQYCLHWAGVIRGSAVCCRIRGLAIKTKQLKENQTTFCHFRSHLNVLNDDDKFTGGSSSAPSSGGTKSARRGCWWRRKPDTQERYGTSAGLERTVWAEWRHCWRYYRCSKGGWWPTVGGKLTVWDVF